MAAKIPHRLFFLLLVSNFALAQKKCYYPGFEAPGDHPCDPDAEESVCCGTGGGAMCLTNKACVRSGSDMARGSCTDESWKSGACPQFCIAGFPAFTYMPSCANVTGSDTSLCCDHSPGCCDTGDGRFELLPSNPQPFAVWDEAKSRFVKPTSTTTTLSTSSSSTTTSTTTSTDATDSETTQATTDGSPPPQPSNQDSNQDSNQTESPSLSVGAQAGIGAGVSVCGILLGVIAWVLWKLYQSKKGVGAGGDPPGPPDGYYYDYGTQQQQQQQYYPPAGHESLYMESVPQEMFSPPSELYTEPPSSELYGSSKPVEAPGVGMYK